MLLARADFRDAPSAQVSDRAGATRFASFRRFTPVTVTGPLENGLWPIWVDGPMPFRAHLPVPELVARVQGTHAVAGTPALLGVNDIVTVLELRGAEAIIKLEPELDGVITDDGQHLLTVIRGGQRADEREPVFTGLVPLALLGSRFVADPAQHPPGEACRVRGRTELLDVLSRERIVETWGSGTCRRLDVRGDLTELLLGEGPFLHGYVDTDEVELVSNDLTHRPERPIEDPRDALVHMPRNTDRPEIVRVAAGTRISVDGRVVSRLREPGFARVNERGDRTARVEVTVTGRVVLYGTVPLGALGAPAPRPPED